MNTTDYCSVIDENELKTSTGNESIFPISADNCLKSMLDNYTAIPPGAIIIQILEQLNGSKFSNFPLPEFPASLHHFL